MSHESLNQCRACIRPARNGRCHAHWEDLTATASCSWSKSSSSSSWGSCFTDTAAAFYGRRDNSRRAVDHVTSVQLGRIVCASWPVRSLEWNRGGDSPVGPSTATATSWSSRYVPPHPPSVMSTISTPAPSCSRTQWFIERCVLEGTPPSRYIHDRHCFLLPWIWTILVRMTKDMTPCLCDVRGFTMSLKRSDDVCSMEMIYLSIYI